jgi:SAM-dependent methyltransferase
MNSTPPVPAPRKGNLHKRLFAYLNTLNNSYEIFAAARKKALFGGLHGDVLEIGPGSGPNLTYYPADIRWIGVEPNPFMVNYLFQTLHHLGRSLENFRIAPGDPQGVRLPAGDASMDAVVSTLVLCSVPHQDKTLQEILRVLKPGGKFIFIEHVAAPRGTPLRTYQNIIQPLWTLIGDGCHPNRETWETISQAGFARVEMERYEYPHGGPVRPLIAGTAVKGV